MTKHLSEKHALTAIVATVTILTACASPAIRQEKLAALEASTPICSNQDECNAKWDAAQLWVVKNAGWKIQNQSSVLIETYNPSQNSPALAVRATKEPLGGGKFKIVVKTWCANMFGCTPDALDAALNFNKEISATKP